MLFFSSLSRVAIGVFIISFLLHYRPTRLTEISLWCFWMFLLVPLHSPIRCLGQAKWSYWVHCGRRRIDCFWISTQVRISQPLQLKCGPVFYIQYVCCEFSNSTAILTCWRTLIWFDLFYLQILFRPGLHDVGSNSHPKYTKHIASVTQAEWAVDQGLWQQITLCTPNYITFFFFFFTHISAFIIPLRPGILSHWIKGLNFFSFCH